jgi:predicted ATPase with chaperone activity
LNTSTAEIDVGLQQIMGQKSAMRTLEAADAEDHNVFMVRSKRRDYFAVYNKV